MAEALCKQHILSVKDFSPDDWSVASAGCWAYPGIPATKSAVIAVAKYNADLSEHASQPVSADLLEHYQLVLCMEKSHTDFIKRHFPQNSERVFLLSEMINESYEVDDPVGRSQSDYDISAREIDTIIKNGWSKIVTLSSK
jgi:protein-tyrosine-phosphatase